MSEKMPNKFDRALGALDGIPDVIHMFELPGDVRRTADGPRTVTAAATTAPARCCNCGATEPRKELWGIDKAGITTSDLSRVDHWICEKCFCNPRAKP